MQGKKGDTARLSDSFHVPEPGLSIHPAQTIPAKISQEGMET